MVTRRKIEGKYLAAHVFGEMSVHEESGETKVAPPLPGSSPTGCQFHWTVKNSFLD